MTINAQTQSDPTYSERIDAFKAGYVAGLRHRAKTFRWLSIGFSVLTVLCVGDTIWLVVR